MQQHGLCTHIRVAAGSQVFKQPVVRLAQVASQTGDVGEQHQTVIEQVAGSLFEFRLALQLFLQRGKVQAWFQLRIAQHVQHTLHIQLGMLARQRGTCVGQGGVGQKVRAGQLVAGLQPRIAQLNQVVLLLVHTDAGDVAASGDVQVVRVQVMDLQLFIEVLGQLVTGQGLGRSERPVQVDERIAGLIVSLHETTQGLLAGRGSAAIPVRQAVVYASLQQLLLPEFQA